jgi:hypothetical protein
MAEEALHGESEVVRQPGALDPLAEELLARGAARWRHVREQDPVPRVAGRERLHDRLGGACFSHGDRVDPDARHRGRGIVAAEALADARRIARKLARFPTQPQAA